VSYTAPVKDMLFCMKELADLDSIAVLPGFDDAGLETAQAVLEECARFSGEVLAPLNRTGDVQPSTWKDGAVATTPGFRQAFRQFGEGGWQGLQHPPEFGGQGLPKTIGAACIEMINSANLSFALCPLLTDGAIEALMTAGTPAQQERFIPKMISGEWTGTMNLTEAQAGSDLALVRTRAEPLGEGRYRIFGTKISPPCMRSKFFSTKSTPCCTVIQNRVMDTSVIGRWSQPSAICFLKNGTTEPRDPTTLP